MDQRFNKHERLGAFERESKLGGPGCMRSESSIPLTLYLRKAVAWFVAYCLNLEEITLEPENETELDANCVLGFF